MGLLALIVIKIIIIIIIIIIIVIKCPAARGCGGARPNPSIIGARVVYS